MEIKKLTNVEDYFSYQNGRSGMDVSQTEYDLIMEMEPEKDDYILDVGCRTGKVVKRLHDDGFKNAYGIDIGKNANEFWKENLTELYQSGHLKRADIQLAIPPFPTSKFKLVIASHVIEHLHDLSAALTTIGESMEDDGLLFTQVPIQNKDKFDKNNPHYIRFESIYDYIKEIESLGFAAVFQQQGFKAESPEAIVIFKKK